MIISPSILACDFSHLADEAQKVEKAGAQWLHIDVMDGHFVPNITLGPDIVKSIRDKSGAFFDVHLMISDPLFYAERFKDAGADLITFHIESSVDTLKMIEAVKKLGIKVGISLKPNTEAEVLEPYISLVDLVLVMTVEPGFGGQSFRSDMLPKIEKIKAFSERYNKDLLIEVDGGVNEKTAPLAVRAGANVLVAGSAIFNKKDYKDAIDKLC